jgi:hypothetical protein
MSDKLKASEIEKAVDEQCGGFYPMQLVGEGVPAVIRCVNVGIDSHLEACYIEDVDSYEWVPRMVGERVLCTKLHCRVSSRSMAVLLRRLMEDDGPGRDPDDTWEGPMLACDILGTLGFEDCEPGCVEIMSRTGEGIIEPEELKRMDSGAVKRVGLEE